MPKNEDRDDEFEDEDEERRRRLRRRDPDDDDRPRRRRAPEPEVEATEFLIPTGVSRYSIAACYFGLLSCVPIPIFGIVLALIALPCGIAALRKKRKKKRSSYGSVTGDARAIIGVVSSSLTIVGYLGILVLYIMTNTFK